MSKKTVVKRDAQAVEKLHQSIVSTFCLTNESQPKFLGLLQSMVQLFKPFNELEYSLVAEMTGARWRLQRTWMVQTAAIDLQMDQDDKEVQDKFNNIDQPTVLAFAYAKNSGMLELMASEEDRYSKAFSYALDTLRKLRREQHGKH